MSLNFLISISSETESLYGVRFLLSFIGKYKDCNVTFFHINSPKDTTQDSLMSMWDNPNDSAEKHLNTSSRKAINQSKKMLENCGILSDKVKTKAVKEQYGKVKDILIEGANGFYDALILGRRATYTLQWMFDRPADEIPQALVRDASLSSPMWICCEPEEGRKNVLLCLDGSESALRVTDHVGFILSFAIEHHITLFHVGGLLSSNNENIFQEAEAILKKHCIYESRIKKKAVTGVSVTNAILSEKNKGKYAAIAVGLNGLSEKRLLNTQKYVGKTTSTLISKVAKASLWCCP